MEGDKLHFDKALKFSSYTDIQISNFDVLRAKIDIQNSSVDNFQ